MPYNQLIPYTYITEGLQGCW